jgi:hypothetical protein
MRNHKQSGGDGGRGGNARVRGQYSIAQGGKGGEGVVGAGGAGGDAEVEGNRSMAVGGPGGRGGMTEGMRGGDAAACGDNVVAAGGEGGEANQPDGRAGRGGRSGYTVLGYEDIQLPGGTWLSQYGRGGDGGHSPQYSARLLLIGEILGHDVTMSAASAGIRDADTAATVLRQLNERLSQAQLGWRVRITDSCFEFYEP